MGDPRRLRKKYTTPSNYFQKGRIAEEIKYMGRYGLRNKKELWKHRTQLSNFRGMARVARASTEAVQAKRLEEIRSHLSGYGFVSKDAHLDDILSISLEQILDRRLQTLVYKKGMARSIYQARQMVTHGHIAVGGSIIDSPSALIKIEEEKTLEFAPNSPFHISTQKIWGDESPEVITDLAAKETEAIKKDQKPMERPKRGGRGGGRGGGRPEQSGRRGGKKSTAKVDDRGKPKVEPKPEEKPEAKAEDEEKPEKKEEDDE